jgi:hypothetical protein
MDPALMLCCLQVQMVTGSDHNFTSQGPWPSLVEGIPCCRWPNSALSVKPLAMRVQPGPC